MERKSGFTLIEILIGTTLLVLFFGAITLMVQLSMDLIVRQRIRTTAQQVLLSTMEEIRNMPYEDIGTIGGIPSGIIPDSSSVYVNGTTFTISSLIVFVDDAYDGEAPIDTNPTDYKRVRLAVSWGGVYALHNPVVYVTDISNDSIESGVSGGTLSLMVVNASGAPVSGATVQIDNDSVSPEVHLTSVSDVDGLVELPGSPSCVECYEIQVSKTGYTSARTYSTEEIANPNQPHASVFDDSLTEMTFSIDIPSSVTFKAVRTAAQNYSAFQGVQLSVHGSKELGRDALDNPIYTYDAAVVTGSGGQVTVNGLEWDTYTVSIPPGSSVDMAGSWPIVPFSIVPGGSSTYTVVVQAASDNSLLVVARDNLYQPLASASVELSNSAVGYIATASTNPLGTADQSQAYFSGLPTTLTPYSLTVSSLGYQIVGTEATVSGDVIEQFLLNPE